MAAFDINTRIDLIKRRTVPVSTGTFITGRWIALDSNGYASTPSAGATNVYLTILGNENRPDSIGSNSVTVQYGENLYTLNTYGMNDTITAGQALKVDTNGDLVVASGTYTAVAVAFAENSVNQGVTGLKIRTLV